MWVSLLGCSFDPGALGEKEFLPSSEVRRCRFCRDDPSKLKFKKDAHAIPEALGNHYLLTREECDECNFRGSKLEDDLAKHLTVARVLSRVEGKDGNLKHRFGKRPSSIESDAANNRLVVVREVGDDSLITRRIRDGIQYVIKIPGYRPMNVVRALARMAIMLVPEGELDSLEHIRKWLRSEIEWEKPSYDQGFVPGPGLVKVRVGIDKFIGASSGQPYYRLGLSYGTELLSVHLPGPDMQLSEIPLPLPLRSPYPPHDVRWTRTTVVKDEVRRGRTDTFDIHVPALAALAPPSHDEIATAAYFRWLARGAPAESRGAQSDWLDAEQDLLWKQVPFEPEPGGPEALNSAIASK